MLRWKSGVLALVALVLVQVPAWADDFSRGLFWQITPPKGAPSWLVGSIHVGDPRVEPRIVAAERLLGGAKRLVLEVDRQELAKAVKLMNETTDPPFGRGMAVERAARTRTALLAHGVDESRVDRMPVWLAIMVLALPQTGEPGMDMRLLKKATDDKKPVFGLETAVEQIDVIRGLKPETQDAILAWEVDHLNEMAFSLGRIIDAYANQNLTRLFDLTFETTAPETLSAEQQAAVLDRMINQRNARMVERLLPHLKTGRTLIAVGALHLPGILRELDAAGYTVQRLEP